MKRWPWFIFILFIALLTCACGGKAPFPTYQFKLISTKKQDVKMTNWVFSDINGDNIDELIYSGSTEQSINHLFVSNQSLKTFSQFNSQSKIRSFKVLNHPGQNNNWLFYTYNDGRFVYLSAALYEWSVPLKRQDFRFESIARKDKYMDVPSVEWYAVIYPLMIGDIDNDGKYELLCMTSDSFTANPRGLVAYDFDSRKIKWQLDLPTCLTHVFVDDFDGDGTLEILTANYAFKNTTEVKEGIDDSNGWLLMVGSDGKIITRKRLFTDYGASYLAIGRKDKDGKIDIYKLEATWGAADNNNSVELLNWSKNGFVSRKKYEVESALVRNQLNFFVDVNISDQYRLFTPSRTKGLIVLDQNLERIQNKIDDTIQIVWAVGDINEDGKKEIILQTDDNEFIITDHDAHILAKLVNPFPEETMVNAHIVNTGFGNRRLIAIVSPTQIRYYMMEKLALHTLLKSYFYHYRIFLNVIIAIYLIFLTIKYFRLRSFLYQTINRTQSSLIMMKNSKQIRYMNQGARKLLGQGTNIKKERFLQKLSPDIYEKLQDFCRSDLLNQNESIDLTIGDVSRTYQVILTKTGKLTTPYVIIINNPPSVDHEVTGKLQWAEIARRLSHHVRRHISNILLALDPLEKDLSAKTEIEEYFRLIKSEINQIKVFTHAFQRFTELKDYALKNQDIIPSIEKIIKRTPVPSTVTLLKDWSLKSVRAYIEPIRFEEAITNLITNALESMSKGGTLQISVKEFPYHEVSDKTCSVLIEIDDSGDGIPEKYLKEIWEPFFTTKPDGTGIGLPETKKIIESMHGSIEIQSEQGIGTLVTIWLKGADDD